MTTTETTTRTRFRTETVTRTGTDHRGHATYSDALRWAQTTETRYGTGNVEIRIFNTEGRYAFKGWVETIGGLR